MSQNIKFNPILSSGTIQYIQNNLNVSLFKDNHKLYEVNEVLNLLNPKEVIGINKNDFKTINNLFNLDIKYLTI